MYAAVLLKRILQQPLHSFGWYEIRIIHALDVICVNTYTCSRLLADYHTPE